MDSRDEEFEELMERSSLGTPGARQLRERTSPEQAAMVRRIIELRNRIMHARPAGEPAAAVELGQLLRELGYHQQAEQALQEAVELWRRLDADDPTHERRLDLATALTELGTILRVLGHTNEAVLAFQEATGLLDAEEPTRHRSTRRQDALHGQGAAVMPGAATRTTGGTATVVLEELQPAEPTSSPISPTSPEKGRRVVGAQRQTLAKDLVKRYTEGESIRALASSTGRSYGFIHRVLTESGVQLRQRGGARGKKKA